MIKTCLKHLDKLLQNVDWADADRLLVIKTWIFFSFHSSISPTNPSFCWSASVVCKRHKPHVIFCGLKCQEWVLCFPQSAVPLTFSRAFFFFSLSAIILPAIKIYERGTPTYEGCEYKQQEWLEDMSHKPSELQGRQVERQCHREKRVDAAKKHKQTDRQAAVLGSSGDVTQDEYWRKRGAFRGLRLTGHHSKRENREPFTRWSSGKPRHVSATSVNVCVRERVCLFLKLWTCAA